MLQEGPSRARRRGSHLLRGVIALTVAFGHTGALSRPASAATSSAGEASSKTGVYLIWGTDSEATTMPHVRGGQVNVKWSAVEPARGVFDWTELNKQLKVYSDAGRPATVQVNSELKPGWIYDYGIERCGTYTRNGATYDIPKYWDPTFHVLMQEMLESLAAQLRASPYRNAVLGVRASPNLIGTEPYLLTDAGASPTGACLADWTVAKANAAYERSMRLTYNAVMPDIRPILRSNFFLTVNPSPAVRTELLGQDKAWMFGTNSDPDKPVANVDRLYHQWVESGLTRAYYESKAPSASHQLSWSYWRQLMDLGRGVSYVATYATELRQANPGGAQSAEYQAVFDFTNRYAGLADKPAVSPGAWVAFRGGPGPTDDNYDMFMTQLNGDGTPGADATTVAVDSASGTNVIGPSDQRFGRFARRTDIASGKSAIYLRVTPQYKETLVYGSQVAVTYLDQGAGHVTVRWGPGSGDQQTFTKTGTGRWRRVVADVPAGAMVGGLETTADLVVSVSGGDTTFHMVEVERRANAVPSVALTAPATAQGPVAVTASAAAPAGRTLANVRFSVDDVVVGTDTAAPYELTWDSTVVPDGRHTLSATATDSTGATASSVVTTTVANDDVTPPATVTDLSGYAATPTRVELRWSPATDDLGVAGYRVVRDGAVLGTVQGTAFTDATAVAGTAYSYHVVSVDVAGNESPPSNAVRVTTVSSEIRLVASTRARAYANKLTVATPATAPGHVLVASVSSRGDRVTMTPPAGWTLVRRTDQRGYVNQATYYRVVGTTPEPTSYTWVLVGNHSVAAVLSSFSGVDGLNPVEASSGMGGTRHAAITAPSVTTLGPTRMVVGTYSVAIAADVRPDRAMTEVDEVRCDDPARPPLTVEVSTMTAPLAGATGDKTATVATGTPPHVGQLLALRPAASS